MSRLSLCSKCCKTQPYNEITVPIKYGFNDKEHVLIDGIERVCAVCGWHVDDIEISRINREIAEKALKEGKGYTVAPSIDRRGEESEQKEDDEESVETIDTAAGEKIA